jgi:hypothetical protein
MNPGDLIRLKRGEKPRNNRAFGTILKLDFYSRNIAQFEKHEDNNLDKVAQVLWDNGKTGWVLIRRVELI